jgi:hypothetical protein
MRLFFRLENIFDYIYIDFLLLNCRRFYLKIIERRRIFMKKEKILELKSLIEQRFKIDLDFGQCEDYFGIGFTRGLSKSKHIDLLRFIKDTGIKIINEEFNSVNNRIYVIVQV